MFKSFIIGSVFSKIKTSKITGKASDFPEECSDEYCIPLLTAGIMNQGLARYAKKNQCETVLSNVLSVSGNGVNSGAVFYQPHKFAVLQDAYALKVKSHNITSIAEGLYLAAALNKAIKEHHDWTNKAGWTNIKDDTVYLPIKMDECGEAILDKRCIYHKDGYIPDWEYMEQYICAIEKLVIADVVKYTEKLVGTTKQFVTVQ